MKRLLAFLLALTLLAGCTVIQPTEPPTQPTQAPTAPPTEPPKPSLYFSESAVETQTGGAVRVYPLNGYCDGMFLLGDRVVLYYLDEQTQFKAYTGLELTQDAVATGSILFPEDSADIQVTAQGVFCYDPSSHTAVIMNRQLQEIKRVELPREIQGVPVINDEMNTVYFCTDGGIRALDLSTGIAHMLRQQEAYPGVLLGACFGGELLMCAVPDASGGEAVEFVSTETGLQAGKDEGLRWVKTEGQRYILERTEYQQTEYLFGSRDEDVIRSLKPENADAVFPLVGMDSVVTVTEGKADTTLDLYSLETGLRTSSVTAEIVGTVRNVVADANGAVWFMDDQNLYRWEPSMSPAEDETVYTQPWGSSTDPNEAGLLQSQADAAALGETYGLEIRVWKDAVLEPWEKMTPESRADVLDAALEELGSVLAIFPEGMLEELGSICDQNAVTVSIVADTGMEQGQVTWLDGNAYIAVESGDTLRTELLRTLYRVMDTYVMGKNSILDEWDADKPAEDRARYFVEALTPDNEEFFEGWYAQEKLYTLCRAVRRAFGYRYYEAELPWEQYLDEPLY